MTEERGLTIVEQGGILPTPALARDMMDTLQGIMQAVLDDSDYAVIQGKKWRKRSGFTKLRRAFDITIQQLEGEWEDLGDGAFGYRAMVRASFPNGRFEDGDGYCDSLEMSKGRIEATRHNVRAKALTRAKNRATADLLGTGEVSADELTPYDYHDTRQPRQQSRGPRWEQVPPTNGRPYDAETLRDKMRQAAGWQDSARLDGEPITDGQKKAVPGLIAKAVDVAADLADKARHDILGYLFTVDSSAKLTKAEASAIITAWKHKDEGNWDANGYAQAEAARILEAVAIEAGQQELPL